MKAISNTIQKEEVKMHAKFLYNPNYLGNPKLQIEMSFLGHEFEIYFKLNVTILLFSVLKTTIDQFSKFTNLSHFIDYCRIKKFSEYIRLIWASSVWIDQSSTIRNKQKGNLNFLVIWNRRNLSRNMESPSRVTRSNPGTPVSIQERILQKL